MRSLLLGEWGHAAGSGRPRRARGRRGAPPAATATGRRSRRRARRPASSPPPRRISASSRSSATTPAAAASACAAARRHRRAHDALDDAEARRVRRLVRLLEESEAGELTVEEDGVAHHACASRSPRVAAPSRAPGRASRRPAPAPAGRAGPPSDVVRRREPDGRHVLPRVLARDAALRRGGRPRRGRADALHPRGDEALQRAQVRSRRHGAHACSWTTPQPVEFGQPLFELAPAW